MAKRYYGSKGKKSGMISEDMSAFANLPKEVIHRQWPKSSKYQDHTIDDLFSGAQEQMDQDAADMRRVFKKSKY